MRWLERHSYEDWMNDTAASYDRAFRVPLRELVATMVGLRNAEERERRPPCVKCGAETPEQAETMCQPVDCDCPGCRLWPDA